METKKLVLFILLFAVLVGFSLISLGLVNSEQSIVKAVTALKEEGTSGSYLHYVDEAFDAKVLRFLKQENVCAITDEQAEILAESYETETKTFDVNGDQVGVLFVNGNPLNRNIIEQLLGISFEEQCQVVHGNKVIALVTPIFVS